MKLQKKAKKKQEKKCSKDLKESKMSKKGVFGLTSVQSFFAIILGIAMLAYVIVVIMGTLNSSNIMSGSSSPSSATDSNVWINNTGYTLSSTTLPGFASPSVVATRTAGYALFRDNSTYIQINNATSQPNVSITVSAWIKPIKYNDFNRLVYNGAWATNGSVNWMLYYSYASWVFGVSNGTTQFNNGVAHYNSTNWTYLTGIYNGTSVLLYVDGILNHTTAANEELIFNTTNFEQISYSLSASAINGSVSGVRIYNRSLSASEIQTLYYNGRQPTNPITSGLVASYYLNGNSLDSSGLGNNGTDTNVTYGTDTETINSNTYSTSPSFVVTNATSITWNSGVTLYYTFRYNTNQNDANNILGNTSSGISNFFGAINPVYSILAILVIILVLVVLVRVVTGGNIGMGRESMSPI